MGLFDWVGAKGRRDRFAKTVMQRLAARGWPHPMQYDAESFIIDVGGEAGNVALDRTYYEWARHPRRGRVETLDEAIAFIFDLGPPPAFDIAAAVLTPMIRPRAMLEFEIAEGHDDPVDLRDAWRPLGEHLGVHIGLDRPSSLTLIYAKTLRDWGRSFDECLDIAIANLRAARPLGFEQNAHGFYIANSGDQNEAARLLTPEVFASLDLKGDPVVVAASRRCVVVAGSDDDEALDAMAKFVADFLEREFQPLSYAPMVLRAGRWEVFEPSLRPSSIADLQALQRFFDYADQEPMVANHLSDQGRTEEVASPAIFKTPEGLQVLTLWGGPRMLLPRGDFVVLRHPDGTLVRSWEDVERACGGFPTEAPTCAPYYVVSDWPNPEAMAQIEAAPEPDWATGRGFGVANGRLTVFG